MQSEQQKRERTLPFECSEFIDTDGCYSVHIDVKKLWSKLILNDSEESILYSIKHIQGLREFSYRNCGYVDCKYCGWANLVKRLLEDGVASKIVIGE